MKKAVKANPAKIPVLPEEIKDFPGPETLMKAPKIPLNDLYISSFQAHNGNEPEIVTVGNRAVFMFAATDEFYAICQRYNQNELVNVVDFVNTLRRMRGLMLSKRGTR